MQFSAIVALAFAAFASAQQAPAYQINSNASAPFPVGNTTSTGPTASGTGASIATNQPYNNAAGRLSSGALGLVAIGGLAFVL